MPHNHLPPGFFVMEGWVKLHRKISDNGFWKCEPFTRGQAWVDLLLLASHQDTFFYIRGIKVNLKIGQLAWGEIKLAERWKWSRNKLRKFLKELEKEQQIEQQKSNVIQIITIINYIEYQHKGTASRTTKDTAEGTAKGTAKGTTEGHIQEYKEFIIMFNNLKNSKFKGTEKSKRQFNARFKEGYTLDNFKLAITNCMRDNYHRDNPQYLTPEFITRDDKLQKYLNIQQPFNPALRR